MKRWLVGALVLIWGVLTASARAQPLRVDRTGERMRVDGALREWRGARFVTLGQGDDSAVRYALASADDGLYLGAEVSDEQLVRSAGVGPTQDALVLTLAMPDGTGGFKVSEVWLHAGEAGRVKAAAGLARGGRAPTAEPRIQVVEGPRDMGPGYVIEAFIPFALIDASELWEMGRARLSAEDVDKAKAPRLESSLSTAPGARSAELPRIVLGTGQNDFLGSFASSRGLTGSEPRFDLRGNVAGDREPERVAIVDKFVVVYGKHYKQGATYGYFALPFGMGGGLGSAELLDVTNDGLAELLVRVRQRNELGARELLVALSLAEQGIAPLFSLELKKESKGGFVESKLSIDRKSKPVRMRLEPGRAQGLDALTYQESPARDAQPILLPWGELLYQVVAWDGTKLAVVDQQTRAPEKSSKKLTDSAPVTMQQAPSALGIAPQVASSGVGALVEQFKRDQMLLPDIEPERQLTANLTGGPAEEQLFAFGPKLVAVGPDIGGGAVYLAYGLPIAGAQDLLYLGAADVAGDGAKELLVRVRQPLSGLRSPAQGRASTPAGVHREVLMVLRIEVSGSEARVARLLAAEVARRQDKSAIVNKVGAQGGKLTIEPGQAVGFSQASYPYSNEATGGVERLLLPWSDRPVRYRFDGARLLAE